MSSGPCEAVFVFFGTDLDTCGQPGSFHRRACQHEHVRDGYLCPEHVKDVKAGMCSQCGKHPTQSHVCDIAVTPIVGAV